MHSLLPLGPLLISTPLLVAAAGAAYANDRQHVTGQMHADYRAEVRAGGLDDAEL